MFEISGNDISSLGDADLRRLVARLATAELRAKRYPLSCVTAGDDQHAADGGLDVRVECRTDITDPDFVPRRLKGFQVKKPDMPPSVIRDEMRPKGVLRNAIRELADASGVYVIVSAQGSVASIDIYSLGELSSFHIIKFARFWGCAAVSISDVSQRIG